MHMHIYIRGMKAATCKIIRELNHYDTKTSELDTTPLEYTGDLYMLQTKRRYLDLRTGSSGLLKLNNFAQGVMEYKNWR